MTKIWNEAFWKPAPEAAPGAAARRFMTGPVAALAAMTVTIGFVAGPLLDLSALAAEQLLNPAGYIRAVLGTSP
jgi:multicomponent Na+:H+ antiporter subunit D